MELLLWEISVCIFYGNFVFIFIKIVINLLIMKFCFYEVGYFWLFSGMNIDFYEKIDFIVL